MENGINGMLHVIILLSFCVFAGAQHYASKTVYILSDKQIRFASI